MAFTICGDRSLRPLPLIQPTKCISCHIFTNGQQKESFHKVHNSSFQSEIHWSLVVLLDMLLLIVTIHASLLQHTVHWDAVQQYDNNGIRDAYSIAGITDCHCLCAIWLKCFCIYRLKFSKALTGTGWDAIGLDECYSAEHRAFHLS